MVRWPSLFPALAVELSAKWKRSVANTMRPGAVFQKMVDVNVSADASATAWWFHAKNGSLYLG